MNEKKFDYSYPPTENEDVDVCSTFHFVSAENIHPDGQPWKKCCGVCAYTDKYGNRVDHSTRNKEAFAHAMGNGARFFCVHQNENGLYRVCAGWHCRDGRNNK